MTSTPDPDIGATLGRNAARWLKAAKPRARRLATEAGPQAEKASRAAARYARQHDAELMQAALKLVRMRLGPLGMLVDAVAPPPQSQPADAPQQSPGPARASGLRCPNCEAVNAMAARFCDQCGSALWR
jgi:hypothetical protein